MADIFRSGDGLMTFGSRDLIVRTWNAEAERLTGIPASEAIGRPCWAVLRAVDDTGGLVCHAGCSGARQAREGRPPPTRQLHVPSPGGTRRLDVATVVVGSPGEDQRVCMHLLRNGTDLVQEEPGPEAGHLSPRQREVLALLADGVSAKLIAKRLGIAEVTARNHIRAILLELGCHSQLEAVADARRRRLL